MFQYYLRMLLSLPIVITMDILYAILSDYTSLIPNMLIAHLFFYLGINSIGITWLYRPIYRFYKKNEDFDSFCKRVSSLPYLSAIWIFIMGIVYASFVFFYGIKERNYSIAAYTVTFSGILWGYSFFNAFFIFFVISGYTTKLKNDTFYSHGILFSPEKNKISYKLILGFLVLVFAPFILILSDFIILGTFSSLDPISKKTLIMDVYGSIFGSIVCSYYMAKDINTPMNFLLSSIQKVREGNYSHIAPVISNDELGIITANLNRMIEGLAEKELIQNVFGKYVTPAVAKEILKHSNELKGEERYITILFTDIQNYTTISESLKPSQIVELLNEYFSCLVKIIQKHNGVVNKFIGDSIMAIFNVPLDDKEHSKNAVKAAIEIEELCKNRTFGSGIRMSTRIGINSGNTVVGNIGSEDRLEYTVIGDEVNIAARLEQLNKNYNTNILVGPNTYLDTKDVFLYEKIGDIQLKGKSKPIEVYKIKPI